MIRYDDLRDHARALGRALRRIVLPLVALYVAIAAITYASRSESLLGWILIVASVAFVIAFPLFMAARIYFATTLRRFDADLASQLGLVWRRDLNGVRTMQQNEALTRFLRGGEYRRLENAKARRAAALYAKVLLAAQLFGTTMIASVLVLVTTAYVHLL